MRIWSCWRICAYTGARVGEISQLRRQDLIVGYGIRCIRITPEAGTVKAGGYRTAPVHPHLVEQGLVEFIESRPEGPLFCLPKLENDDPVTRAGNVAKKVCKWVRETAGISDPRVQPNHGWRHRFKTLARDVDIPPTLLGECSESDNDHQREPRHTHMGTRDRWSQRGGCGCFTHDDARHIRGGCGKLNSRDKWIFRATAA
jgi:integrase